MLRHAYHVRQPHRLHRRSRYKCPTYHQSHGRYSPPTSGPLPTGERIFVLKCLRTKWPEIKIILRGQSTDAESIIGAMEQIFTTHGIPDQIMTDNGPPFNSIVCKHCQTIRVPSSQNYSTTPSSERPDRKLHAQSRQGH